MYVSPLSWTSFSVSLVRVTPAQAREFKLPNELQGDVGDDVESGPECSSSEILIGDFTDAMIGRNMN